MQPPLVGQPYPARRHRIENFLNDPLSKKTVLPDGGLVRAGQLSLHEVSLYFRKVSPVVLRQHRLCDRPGDKGSSTGQRSNANFDLSWFCPRALPSRRRSFSQCGSLALAVGFGSSEQNSSGMTFLPAMVLEDADVGGEHGRRGGSGSQRERHGRHRMVYLEWSRALGTHFSDPPRTRRLKLQK